MPIRENAYTTKQMGDACEMLIAAELTLAGVPALKVPDNWPHYDVVAQKSDSQTPQTISVKSRTFKNGSGTYVSYDTRHKFDWLAIVLLPGDGERRRFYLVPKVVADEHADKGSSTSKIAHEYGFRQDRVPKLFAAYENNFRLLPAGNVER